MTDEERADVYRRTFGTEQGILCLEDLKRSAGWCDGRFVEDARRADFRAGMRSVIAYIINTMEGDK